MWDSIVSGIISVHLQNNYDILDVLERRVHIINEWMIVLERWIENPPEYYLQHIFLLIQISKISANFYSIEVLTVHGDLIGKFVVVNFDPMKPITQDFVRVKVFFRMLFLMSKKRRG